MRRIHDRNRIDAAVDSGLMGPVFRKLEGVCLIEYEVGEYPDSPFSGGMLQVVEEGSVEIYMLRADGTSFSLGTGGKGTLLGDIEVMLGESSSAIAEAKEKTLCLAAPLRGQREILLNDTLFLRTAASDMAGMIRYMMEKNASSRTLRESILAYMDFACPDQTFRGIQQAAYHLHASSRQLQRVMNQLTEEGITQKVGKGAYRLRKRESGHD